MKTDMTIITKTPRKKGLLNNSFAFKLANEQSCWHEFWDSFGSHILLPHNVVTHFFDAVSQIPLEHSISWVHEAPIVNKVDPPPPPPPPSVPPLEVETVKLACCDSNSLSVIFIPFAKKI